MSVLIRQTNWQQDRAALQQIRLCVFVQEQQVPLALEWDEWDAQAIHVLAEDPQTQTALGCARLVPSGQIGRVAVLPPWRCQGIGTALVCQLLNIAQQQQLNAFLHAQTTTLRFYQRLGFQAAGDIFYEAGIAHQFMHFNSTPGDSPCSKTSKSASS